MNTAHELIAYFMDNGFSIQLEKRKGNYQLTVTKGLLQDRVQFNDADKLILALHVSKGVVIEGRAEAVL